MSRLRLLSPLLLLAVAGTARAENLHGGVLDADIVVQVADDLDGYTVRGGWTVAASAQVKALHVSIPVPTPDARVKIQYRPHPLGCQPTNGVCVVDIPLPGFGDQRLSWTITGKMSAADTRAEGSEITTFGPRTLSLPLIPADLPAPVHRLRLRVEPGAAKGLVHVTGLAGVGPTWSLRHVDPHEVPVATIRVDAGAVLTQRDLAGRNDLPSNRGVTATGSTTKEDPENPGIYHAKNAVDGDVETAWCEGVPGDGAGESIDVVVPGVAPDCRVEGVAVTPGFTRDAAYWKAYGKPTRVRVQRCGKDGVDLSFGSAPRWDGATVLVTDPSLAGGAEAGTLCVRVTMLVAHRGDRKDETCIAEVTPVLTCPK